MKTKSNLERYTRIGTEPELYQSGRQGPGLSQSLAVSRVASLPPSLARHTLSCVGRQQQVVLYSVLERLNCRLCLPLCLCPAPSVHKRQVRDRNRSSLV